MQNKVDDIIELQAHHEPGTPIYRLCDFIIALAKRIEELESPATAEENPYGNAS